MNIHIRPDMLIGEVQKQFNSMFPYLQLEFYKSNADIKEGKKLGAGKRIVIGQEAITDSLFDVMPDMTVKELETQFRKLFTLTVQVFRKSGTTWLQTTITDDWTLQRQNEHGREITEGSKRHDIETPDYDLERDADH